MYVCVCKSISDSQIVDAICNNGACSIKCLAKKLGVATQCGKCVPLAKEILKETLQQEKAFPLDTLLPAT